MDKRVKYHGISTIWKKSSNKFEIRAQWKENNEAKRETLCTKFCDEEKIPEERIRVMLSILLGNHCVGKGT